MTTRKDGVTALLIDDDPLARAHGRRGLQRAGCAEVIEAVDGVEAQDILRTRRVDLVVTDLLMPRLDGIELMRWAQQNVAGPTWIILSGVDTFDAAIEAIRLGAFEFLSKPVDVRQLEVVVRNALAQRALEKERDQLFGELEESNRALAAKVRELEEKSHAIRRDLERAEIIQRALLPHSPPSLEGFSLQTFYRPGLYVGGDLYNVVRVSDRFIALYVADATGHGVSSAMLSVLFDRKLILAQEGGARPIFPARVLASVNRSLCAERIAPGLFLTAAYCLLDTVSGEAILALAGHPPALLRRSDGRIEAFPRTGPALGLAPHATYSEERFRLEPDDRLLLYTDGLLAAARGARAGRAWLEETLERGATDGRELVELLGGTGAAGDDPDEDRDDVTVLLLDAQPGASRFDNGESVSVARRAGVPSAREPVVFYGESAEGSFFALRGRGTWSQCDAMNEAVAGIIDEGRPVTIDLAECEYLDSTFLGTLHELVMRARARRAALELQRVPPALREQFDELSMNAVLGHVLEEARELPAGMQPLAPVEEPAGSQWRILRAHEALAALSARNREKFLAIVETIRAQIGE